MLQGERTRTSASVGAGLPGATDLDSGTDQRAQRVVRRSFLGQQNDVAVVLAGESEQPPLPRFTSRGRGTLGEIEDDDAKGSTAQEQLGGFAQGVRLRAAGVGATGKRHMDDEQCVQVDAARCEIGRVEGTSAGLNPRRRLSCLLCISQNPNRSRGPRSGDGSLGVS